MKKLITISIAIILLVLVTASLPLLPQSWFSAVAEQAHTPLNDSTYPMVEGGYPPPTPPLYPPPGSESRPAINRSSQVSKALLTDAKMYASANNVSVDEAVRRLIIQSIAENLNAELMKTEKATFAGLWLQHDPEFQVIVRFTGNGAKTLEPHLKNTPITNLVKFQTAEVNFEDLKQEQNQAAQILAQSNMPFRTGINVIDNRVEIYVLDLAGVTAFIRNSGISFPEHTRISQVDVLYIEVADIYGGLALSYCTSGFSVVNIDGTAGITTAGHCENQQYFNGILLPFKAGTVGGDYDIQWNQGDHAFNVVGRINYGSGERAILYEKFRVSQIIGGYVCKYGMTTGYGCGNIAEVYVNGTNVRVDNITVDQGDSGGPWFLSNTAYGTTIYKCKVGEIPCAVYGPVDIIHEILGLTLAYRVYLPMISQR